MFKKIVAILLSSVLAVSALAGCGSDSSSKDTGSAAGTSSVAQETKKEPVTINLWTLLPDDTLPDSIPGYIKAWSEKYQKENEHVTLKITHNQTMEKLLTAVSSGSGPDIFYNQWPNCATWSDKGALYDMTELVNNDKNFDKDDFVKGAWDRGVYKNKVYGIPFGIASSEIFYNVDLLKEAGYDAPPKTIEELVEMAVKLTKYDSKGNITQAGFIPDMPWLDNVLWPVAFGANWIDTDTNKITFDSPEMAAAYQWMVDLNQKIGADKLLKFKSSLSKLDSGSDPFVAGKVAMMFSGEWEFGTIEKFKPDMNYEVAPIPYPAAKPELAGSMFITTNVWNINAKTKVDINEVWNALSSLTSKETYTEMAKGVKGAGQLMGRKSALDSFPSTANPKFKDVANMLKNPNTSGFPMLAYVNEYLTYINDEMTLALSGKQTVAEAQKKVVEKVQPLADKNPINK